MKVKVEITRCYLVQAVDEYGNDLKHEYVFENRKEALERGKYLKELAEREEQIYFQ